MIYFGETMYGDGVGQCERWMNASFPTFPLSNKSWEIVLLNIKTSLLGNMLTFFIIWNHSLSTLLFVIRMR